MNVWSNIALGFSVISEPMNLVFCFVGVLLGTLIGVLPGLGPGATISLLLPLTYHLNPVASVIMVAGIYIWSKIWRINHLHPSQYSRGGRQRRHLSRRLPNGSPRKSGPGSRDCCFWVFHCRHFCHTGSHAHSACVGQIRPSLRAP